MQTLAQLAQIIKAELLGDPQAVVRRAQSFELAEAGDITFATDAAYRARINESRATAIIVASAVPGATANLLVTRSPKLAFARAIQALHAVAYQPLGVSHDLVVGEGTALGELSGTGLWQLSSEGEITTARYDWQVETTKRWMNLLTPIARPIFKWNHDLVMGWGAEGLAKELGVELVAK